MKIGATFWLIVQGVALIVTGFLAAAGMTFVCFVQNQIFARTHDVLDIGPDIPVATYPILFALMAAWLIIAGLFAWRNRTRPGLILSVIAFLVFALSATNVLRFAYPVCNAF
ncbi:MAG: hypothetical protein QM647_14410 [Asticcacaulis sp.]|uniref:hypothetical protein n=1 Tax=Asticcacaulis sp. TaxID=1872648 RepID=UPI0039E21D54